MTAPVMKVRELGRMPYRETWTAMRRFTDERGAQTADELWLLEHPPVYTQGLAGKPEHVLAPGDIPVIQTDRGGQVTYHGPGQLIAYPLLDLNRLGIGIRSLVSMLEDVVIAVLADSNIDGQRKPNAPGVFVGGAKIASIGMKVRRGCTFHGLSFNLAMDLSPFLRINPCGFADQPMTRLSDLVENVDPKAVGKQLAGGLAQRIGLDWAIEATHDDSRPLGDAFAPETHAKPAQTKSNETKTTEFGS